MRPATMTRDPMQIHEAFAADQAAEDDAARGILGSYEGRRMTEFTNAGGVLGRSIHDAPERSRKEIESERVMASVTRQQLEDALVILLRAIRDAESEQGLLQVRLRPHVAQEHRDAIDSIGEALIEDGIDLVVDLLGDEVVDTLEGEG